MNHSERNKALVLEAMTALFQRKDPSVIGQLYAPDYIQHNPAIPQGRDALAKLIPQLPADLYYEPGMVVAEGAFVAIHGRIRGWGPKPQVVIDIFRVEDGKLAEHWDVLQDEAAIGSTSGIAMFSPDEAAKQATVNHAVPTAPAERIEYATLMLANLSRVFGERNAGKRIAAIRTLYTEYAVLSEPHRSVKGHLAINQAVTDLLAGLPATFEFTALGPAIGHHGVGRLCWRSGPAGGPPAVTGMDVAHFEGSRIQALFVFLDPPTP